MTYITPSRGHPVQPKIGAEVSSGASLASLIRLERYKPGLRWKVDTSPLFCRRQF